MTNDDPVAVADVPVESAMAERRMPAAANGESVAGNPKTPASAAQEGAAPEAAAVLLKMSASRSSRFVARVKSGRFFGLFARGQQASDDRAPAKPGEFPTAPDLAPPSETPAAAAPGAETPTAVAAVAETLPVAARQADGGAVAAAEAGAPPAAPPEAEITEPAAPEPSPPDLRSEMVARFGQWLDRMLAGEPPPRGVPERLLAEAAAEAAVADGHQPAPETDLFTLFSSLTALTGEIRLQGRAFKQLTDLLAPLAETPAALAELLQAVESEKSARLEVPFDQVCDVMIDLYDRLQRGLRTCDDGIASLTDGIASLTAAKKPGWFARLFAAPDSTAAVTATATASVRAIRDAGALTVARLQAAQQQWGIQRIGQAGDPFDPERMTAVEVRTAANVPPGTVLEVQRSGYSVHGVPKATAQVTVSKAAV